VIETDTGEVNAGNADVFTHYDLTEAKQFISGWLSYDKATGKFGYVLGEPHPFEQRLRQAGIEDWSDKPGYMRDFDPDQPRNEKGEWSSGGGFTLYHGSGHAFSKFAMEHIGEGE